MTDLELFARAVAATFPENASRDRYGRINGARDTDDLRKLALKYDVAPCGYIDEQVGAVARAILDAGGVPRCDPF